MPARCLAFLVVCFMMVAAARADRIELMDGDVLFGRVVANDGRVVVVEHPTLGRLEMDAARVRRVSAEAGQAPRPAASPAPASAAAPAAPLRVAPATPPAPEAPADPGLFEAWKLRLALGLSSRQVNGSQTVDFNAHASARRAVERSRARFEMAAFLADRNGTKAREDFHVLGQHDWLTPGSPWFWFGEIDYDHEDFKTYEHRVGTLAGIGYDLKPGGHWDVTTRLGLGATAEAGGFFPNEEPASLFGGEIEWKVDRRNKIEIAAQTTPVFESDAEGVRLTTRGGWTTKLTEQLSFRLGFRRERDTTVPAAFERTDTRVFGSLALDF